MKKLLLLLSSVIFFIAAHGQSSIPNGNFEQWTSGTYQTPQNYPISSNPGVFFRSNLAFNVTQTTDSYHGSYALQLTTLVSGIDTAFGYLISTNKSPQNNISTWTGGIPYNQIPTGIRGYYKYNIASADSASILVIFSHAGVNIGTYIYRIGGIKNNYTLFNFTFNPALTTTPDSVTFGAISCRITSATQKPTGGIAGEILKIDSVSFTGVSSQPALMNGDFELWQSYTVNRPNSWYYEGDDQGDGMNRTTDAAAGSYAMELTTYLGNSNNHAAAQSGYISTGYYNNTSNSMMGGYPFTNQVDTLAFSYKYAPAHPSDSAGIYLEFKKNGSSVNGMSYFPLASSTYQYVEVPFNTMTAVDSVIVQIQSSNWDDTLLSYVGADLKIDEIHFKSQPLNTGIKTINYPDNGVTIFPNPSNGNFRIISTGISIKSIAVYNVLGERVWYPTNFVTQTSSEVNLTYLQKGIYFIEINSGEQVFTRKIIIE